MAERRLWTEFEDNALRYLRQECQIQKWSEIASKMIQIFNITDRNEKQCRDRYTNSLNPNLNLNDWNEDDQLLLIECHKKYGNKWTIIAQKFKGRQNYYLFRTDSFIKNHFYSRLRKCIRKLNRFIDEEFKKKYKKLNLNIIFKLTNLVQDKLTKISQDVREFYEKLMYDLVNFSLKAQQGIRQYDPNQIQTFVLALTSLENLSGAIGANRKPKRGRGHKREEKYLISTDGLCLVLLQDQLILRKQTQLEFDGSGSIISGDESEMSDENDESDMSEGQSHQAVGRIRYCVKTSEIHALPVDPKNSLSIKPDLQENTKQDLVTKVCIEEKETHKQVQIHPHHDNQREDTIMNEHEHSCYEDIMEYIMQNSFDYNDNILSLSKQGSLQFDNLF